QNDEEEPAIQRTRLCPFMVNKARVLAMRIRSRSISNGLIHVTMEALQNE
ncbi:unnamed protein product, partial [Brassica oleracea var. botrytis]